jgi:hypothetical protein
MALLTKKDFAARCNLATRELSTYIKRGKVVCVDDLIETTNEANRAFLEKWSGRNRTRQKSKAANEVQVPNSENSVNEGNQQEIIPELSESERRLKYLETEKRGREIEKLQIEIDKKKGEVVPSGLLIPLIERHNHFLQAGFVEAGEKFLAIVMKKYEISAADLNDYNSSLARSITSAIDKAIKGSKSSFANIIQEFAVTRGVGEHD